MNSINNDSAPKYINSFKDLNLANVKEFIP